jgi:hypothetical protein
MQQASIAIASIRVFLANIALILLAAIWRSDLIPRWGINAAGRDLLRAPEDS